MEKNKEKQELNTEYSINFASILTMRRVRDSVRKVEEEREKQGKFIKESLGKIVEDAKRAKLTLPQFIPVTAEEIKDMATGIWSDKIIGYSTETMEAVSIIENPETRTSTLFDSDTLPEDVRARDSFKILKNKDYVGCGEDIALRLIVVIQKAAKQKAVPANKR